MAENILVFDNGSGYFKAGFASNNLPIISFPSIVGNYRFTCFNEFGYSGMDSMIQVGYDALKHKEKLYLSYAFDYDKLISNNSHISSQEEEVFNYTFNKKLNVNSEECCVLFTEPVYNSKANREALAKLFFESYNIQGIYIASQGVLPLYASGLTNGLVVNCGHSETSSTPIYEGYSLQNSTKSMKLGGKNLNEYLNKSLNNQKLDFILNQEHINDIKEKLCYVALNYKEKLLQEPSLNEVEYKLPDDKIIKLNNSELLFKCPEVLFQPKILDTQLPSIHELINDSIISTDIDARRNLYSNIVLAGGSTLFQGFPERLETELNLILNKNETHNLKLNYPKDRVNSTWLGGSILASLSTFKEMYVTLTEYHEYGPNIIHRKCF